MSIRRPRRRPGENRQHLIEAGLVQFGHLGFYAASTASIAQRAGVPQPHVYASFANKQELFIACCSAAQARLIEAITARDTPHPAHVCLLLQASTVVRDEQLSASSRAFVTAVREAAGDVLFSELLDHASRILLSTDVESE